MRGAVLLLALGLAAPTGAAEPRPLPAAPSHATTPPDGWTDLRTVHGLRIDARYHTADNFTGAPLPGYGVPGAWLLDGAAKALGEVQEELAAEGLGLLVYDAYRPRRASLAMVAWAERSGQPHLVTDGYIARRSNHNRGTTVDLTLVDGATGEPLDMGTPWDTLTPEAHVRWGEGEVRVRRDRLVAAMRAHGFRSYSKEWWHFRWEGAPEAPHRDVPYACFEASEGDWTPPGDWTDPTWVPPSSWPTDPSCTQDASAPGGP